MKEFTMQDLQKTLDTVNDLYSTFLQNGEKGALADTAFGTDYQKIDISSGGKHVKAEIYCGRDFYLEADDGRCPYSLRFANGKADYARKGETGKAISPKTFAKAFARTAAQIREAISA